MGPRKIIIIGNWKMHLNVQQASLLVQHLQENIKTQRLVEVVLAPSMLALQPLSLQIDRRRFRLADDLNVADKAEQIKCPLTAQA